MPLYTSHDQKCSFEMHKIIKRLGNKMVNNIIILILLVGLALSTSSAFTSNNKNKNTISKGTFSILNSETLPGDLLPQFYYNQAKVEGGFQVKQNPNGGRGNPITFVPDDSCTDDIFVDINEDLRSPQLPYLTQGLWTCDRKAEDIPVWFLENDFLKVTLNPQYGGRIASIYDKKREREYLFNNKAHQPANIGVLKSWASGGAEWNWSPGIIGHSAFTETTVWMQQFNSSFGPSLRVYEYDRYNSTTWQVDILLVDDTVLVHPRVTNPTDVDLRGYWWTCVAVPSTPSTRIITPATHVTETSRLSAGDAPWPYFADGIENSTFKGYQNAGINDESYLGNHPSSGDFFLRISDTEYTPYIGHTDTDGFVVLHGHPLNGTKFFTWGQSGPGRFMQDFLAGGLDRQGDYTELQVGVAPTQMQTFSLPKNSVREWTEWFKGAELEKEKINSPEYSDALKSVDTWIRSSDGMPKSRLAVFDAYFQELASKGISSEDQVLVTGQPWGALEEMRLKRTLAPGLHFALPKSNEPGYIEALPWVELLTTGTFSQESQNRLPVSYQTTDAWYNLILESSNKFGMTWLHALHLGVGLAERGMSTEARSMFESSMSLKSNPIASRCIGLLTSSTSDLWTAYLNSMNILQSSFASDASNDRLTMNLVNEMGIFLQQQTNQWASEWADYLALVPPQFKSLDSVLKIQIMLNLNNKQFAEAMEVLSANCFPTYATDRDDLMAFWNSAAEGYAGAVTNLEKHQARMTHPIPRNIGCQKGSKYCLNYWR